VLAATLWIVLRLVAFAAGVYLVVATLASSLKTVILPRGVQSRLSRVIFLSLRNLFDLAAGRDATYERRDEVLSLYGPLSLLALLATWIVLVIAGYTAMFWAVQGESLWSAFQLSGSSVFTLGFAPPRTLPTTLLVLSEAGIGLIELALLITYMPSLYGAFQRRESLVSLLEVRAGSPPSGVELLLRFHRIHGIEHLTEEVWEPWETWFVDIEESHTSMPALPFFRSPQPDRSWITAAGAVLDGAALLSSSVAVEKEPHLDLCLRAGYLSLRRVADSFRIAYNPSPLPDDPIQVARGEFDEAYDQLAAGGLPMKPDRDQCWRDFSGWRVNYETVLIKLTTLLAAPYARWSSDRALMTYGSALSQAVRRPFAASHLRR
jgi:hypothetical protein